MAASFSSMVKKELFASLSTTRHCRIAELSAIIDVSSNLASKKDNSLIQQRVEKILKQDFDGIDKESIFSATNTTRAIKSDCCKRAYLKGIYLCAGTMSNPQKTYHLEFAVDNTYKQHLINIFDFFKISSKEHIRKTGNILYFKEAEQISTILNVMGAHAALIEFENYRVDKDVNNTINRVANAAAANEDRLISASARHIKDIMDIKSSVGLSALDANLLAVATLRVENPLATLEEIAASLDPPISKSGVNHRLKKIGKIANQYRTLKEVGQSVSS